MKKVTVDYVGYQGHFCVACLYHLTTIISNSEKYIMVSTVGKCPDLYTQFSIIRPNCLFETLVFEAEETSLGFIEAKVDKELDYKFYPILSKEQEANLLGNRLDSEELNNLIIESEKQANLGHKLLVDKWIKILKEK